MGTMTSTCHVVARRLWSWSCLLPLTVSLLSLVTPTVRALDCWQCFGSIRTCGLNPADTLNPQVLTGCKTCTKWTAHPPDRSVLVNRNCLKSEYKTDGCTTSQTHELGGEEPLIKCYCNEPLCNNTTSTSPHLALLTGAAILVGLWCKNSLAF